MRKKIDLPLSIFSRHLSTDVGQLHDAINKSIVDIDVTIDSSCNCRLESYLADFKQEDFQASFIQYGVRTQIQCLQDNYYCIVIPYSGQHSIRHKEFNFEQNKKVSFIPPLTNIDMQYSPDCGHLVLRFKASPFIDEVFRQFYNPEFINNPNIQNHLFQISMRFIHNFCFIKKHDEADRIINDLKQEIYDLILTTSTEIQANGIFDTFEVKEIIEFINNNIKWEYNVEDLAVLSSVPIRTLYWRFKKQTGISPYRYYLNCKLKCARLDILKFGSALTITEIAIRYGFVHLSRFSSQYRALFGELPKHTMNHACIKRSRKRNSNSLL